MNLVGLLDVTLDVISDSLPGAGLLAPPLQVPEGGSGGVSGSLIGTDELTR